MKPRKILKKLLGGCLMVLVLIIAVNYQIVLDFTKGLFYAPSSEMADIRARLDLTKRGEFLFNASGPELNTEKEFNINCHSQDESSAVLGCYTGQRIYVYHIKSDELNGVLEVTAAHELLHAVYERMSAREKEGLKNTLEVVYSENREILEKELENYDAAERLEEIYVRAGTEIKELPEELERHFAEIFKDQDKVASFYESYIGVFRKLEAEFASLEAEMKNLEESIGAKTAEYEKGTSDLNEAILRFNNCANTAGCFKSNYEFTQRRNELLSWQNSLEVLYDEIDGLIEKYNADVVKYNNNVVRHENLQNLVNSHVKVDGL